jgi:hypothetical protein
LQDWCKKAMRHAQKLEPTNVSSGHIAGKTGLLIINCQLLQVYLLIHHLAIQNLEGIKLRFSIK